MHGSGRPNCSSVGVDAKHSFGVTRHGLRPGQLQRRGDGACGNGDPGALAGLWLGIETRNKHQAHDSHDHEQLDAG